MVRSVTDNHARSHHFQVLGLNVGTPHQRVPSTMPMLAWLRATQMSPSRIKSAVASVMCVSVSDIESRNRTKPVALARHIAMYLTYHDGRTLMDVAKIFGRHHAAVINSVKQVNHWRSMTGRLRT